MLKAIIFDMDGVLLDSETVHYEVNRAMFAQYGFTYKPEHVHRYCGTPDDEFWPKLLVDLGAENLSPEEMFKEHWHRYWNKLNTEGMPYFPGTAQCLTALRQAGLRLAVASASPPNVIADSLTRLELDSYFDSLVSATFCQHGKPEPDVFLLAAERLNVSPAECLVVEDSRNGMQAARKAGMKYVGFCGAKLKPDMSLAQITFDDYRKVTPQDFYNWYQTL